MRYLFLILLNLPVILLALINIVTQFKLKKVTKERFRFQLILWIIVLIVLIASFPIYNLLAGHPLLDSRELSLFDIVQTTAIIFLFYVINRQRQKNEQHERMLRDLHQELSIKLSQTNGKN
jgi:hypothetical protein